MEQAVTAAEMREIDKAATALLGVPSIVLMENAGRGAADAIAAILEGRVDPLVVFLCGTGNNGGDGFVAARHLLLRKVRCAVFVLGEASRLKGDAAINFRILKKLGVPVQFSLPPAQTLAQADLVVDALFGIGLNRALDGEGAAAVAAVNGCGATVVALDIPSGLDATTGQVHGACVKAHTTVTFHLPKTGMFRDSGPEHTGEIIVKNIGIRV